MFYYDIEDGGVIIYYVNDNTITSIDIPRFIGGYPISYVPTNIFEDTLSLEYINGVKLKIGVNVIDNRFVFKLSVSIIFNIKYQIGSDYYVCCHYYSHSGYSYLINDMEYVGDLRY